MYHTFICDTERVSINTHIGVIDRIDKFTKPTLDERASAPNNVAQQNYIQI